MIADQRERSAGGEDGREESACPAAEPIGRPSGRGLDGRQEPQGPGRSEVGKIGQGSTKRTELGDELGASAAGRDVGGQRGVGGRIGLARSQRREALVVRMVRESACIGPDAPIP